MTRLRRGSSDLAAAPDRPTLIMMHQPPFECGIPYMDPYACREGHRLAQIVARYPAGRAHRLRPYAPFDAGEVRWHGLCTAPSTTTTIALRLEGEDQEASYLEPPAMLLHQWRPGTGLITHHHPDRRLSGSFSVRVT